MSGRHQPENGAGAVMILNTCPTCGHAEYDTRPIEWPKSNAEVVREIRDRLDNHPKMQAHEIEPVHAILDEIEAQS